MTSHPRPARGVPPTAMGGGRLPPGTIATGCGAAADRRLADAYAVHLERELRGQREAAEGPDLARAVNLAIDRAAACMDGRYEGYAIRRFLASYRDHRRPLLHALAIDLETRWRGEWGCAGRRGSTVAAQAISAGGPEGDWHG